MSSIRAAENFMMSQSNLNIAVFLCIFLRFGDSVKFEPMSICEYMFVSQRGGGPILLALTLYGGIDSP